ncbi:TPR repeat (plasmid) [Acidisarcina polymorpha]|uniref:TPR repeat n=1 Tax=Acidisarcina polymorpha TaxID=2211140 RepID=A0A2Z5GCR1_9BACT|nr:tetratricopeptide repeat protein [Acidisarcina polymorpha]AXC16366.1 TPR repeat [Acidisarcina polymorpha]
MTVTEYLVNTVNQLETYLYGAILCAGPTSFLVVLIVMAGGNLPLALAQNVSTEALDHFRAAHEAQQAGRLDEAAREYETVNHLQPGIAEVSANLGLVYYAQAKFADSAHAFQTAERLKPDLLVANLWLGVDLVNLNQPLKAVPYLKRAISIQPEDQQAQRWLGTALWNAGDTYKALDQFQKANQLFPTDLDILFVLGEAYRKAADKEIDAVLSQATGSPLLNVSYGDKYREEEDWTKAIAHYTLALDKDPRCEEARLGLGEVYLMQNSLTDAQNEFHADLENNPLSARAHAGLARIALLTGDYQKALDLLDHALRISPDETAASLGLPPSSVIVEDPGIKLPREELERASQALHQLPESNSRSLAKAAIDAELGVPDWEAEWKQFLQATARPQVNQNPYAKARDSFYRRDFDSAKTEIRVWLTSHPGDLQARYLLAKTLRSLSVETLDRLFKQDADSYRTHQLLAQVYAMRGENEKALAEYARVVQMNPSLPGVHFEIGHLLWEGGDSDHAIEELKKELQLDSANPEANGEMGSILVEQHQPQNALPFLLAAVAALPDRTFLYLQLGKAYYLLKHYQQSEAALRKAALRDDDGSAHYQLGVLYRAESKPEDARREFSKSDAIKAERLADVKLVPQQAAPNN